MSLLSGFIEVRGIEPPPQPNLPPEVHRAVGLRVFTEFGSNSHSLTSESFCQLKKKPSAHRHSLSPPAQPWKPRILSGWLCVFIYVFHKKEAKDSVAGPDTQ